MACESCDNVEQSSSSVSSSPSSLSMTQAILADFDEVKGFTKGLILGFGADTVSTFLVSRIGEVTVSMIRPERRRRLEPRSSSLEIVEPFRFTMFQCNRTRFLILVTRLERRAFRSQLPTIIKNLNHLLPSRTRPFLLLVQKNLEEENWPWCTLQFFYRDVVHSKYQVLYKLGYGTTVTIWMCRDLQSVPLLFVYETS